MGDLALAQRAQAGVAKALLKAGSLVTISIPNEAPTDLDNPGSDPTLPPTEYQTNALVTEAKSEWIAGQLVTIGNKSIMFDVVPLGSDLARVKPGCVIKKGAEVFTAIKLPQLVEVSGVIVMAMVAVQ